MMLPNTLISLALGWVLGYGSQTDGAVCRDTIGGILDGLNHGPDDARTPSNARLLTMGTRNRTEQEKFRRSVFVRDGGKCAACGLSCCDVLCELESLWGEVKAGTADPLAYLDTLAFYGVDSPTLAWPPGLWEADHVTPLHLGGTNALDNGQTLCLKCHRAKTTAENLARFCAHEWLDEVCAFCGIDSHLAVSA